MEKFKHFIRSEEGAVTVDWVVLTAAIIGFGLVVLVLIAQGTNDVSTGVGANLSAGTVRSLDVPTFN